MWVWVYVYAILCIHLYGCTTTLFTLNIVKVNTMLHIIRFMLFCILFCMHNIRYSPHIYMKAPKQIVFCCTFTLYGWYSILFLYRYTTHMKLVKRNNAPSSFPCGTLITFINSVRNKKCSIGTFCYGQLILCQVW